ncbi:dihydrofolate reductase family protein [Arthrobacter sp. ISL-72]|uniref:dihydrofolate reductase family protein n=1 Tax=Arthrobacter sp. ISL-72 TaxID=2819114 RepID=UPI002035F6B3|nr:dihydrofolate reductase family protein [Arthrobacter sp. ISL-72]
MPQVDEERDSSSEVLHHDNIAAGEDGGLSFVSGEPLSETTNPAFKASVMGFIDSVDTMMLGANTYVQSVGYWPYADEEGEYGEKLNNLTKFVASSKLDDAPWGDFPAVVLARDPAATILELKEQSGKDIWLWGSLRLMHSLMDAGAVDEVRMLVCPASRGKGTRIFEDRQILKLAAATPFENGVVLLRYEIKKYAESPHCEGRHCNTHGGRPRDSANGMSAWEPMWPVGAGPSSFTLHNVDYRRSSRVAGRGCGSRFLLCANGHLRPC